MTIETTLKQVLDQIVPPLQKYHHQARTGPGKCRPASYQQAFPSITGLTGIHGSGKTPWASSLVSILKNDYSLQAIQISLDDFYRTREDLVKLRDDNRDSKLLGTRGYPGTHAESLACKFFESLRDQREGSEILIPTFHKSRHNGERDRAPIEEWPRAQLPVDFVMFEGWCVGFQPLEESKLKKEWELARVKKNTKSQPRPTETLSDHELQHLLTINQNLEQYCQILMRPEHFDFLIQLDTDNLENVYLWRLQQEAVLIKLKGHGLSEEGVVAFVRGYMPTYELYLKQLRIGFYVSAVTEAKKNDAGLRREFRFVQNRDRQIQHLQVLN